MKSSKAACALVVYLLRSVNGLRILRVSAVAALIAFPGFLLAPGVVWRLVRLAVLGLLRAGWYTIPKARLFDEFEGSSGTAVALSDLGDLAIRLVPLGIGLLAERVGLGPALWVGLAAPVSLLLFVPTPPRDG